MPFPASPTHRGSREAFAFLTKRSRVPLLAGLWVLGLAGASAAEVAFKITDQKGAPVPDAVVSLVPLDAPVKITPPAEPLVIAQQRQEFIPYVTPLVIGATVSFPNLEEKIEHQVYSLSPTKKFELPLYKPGKGGAVPSVTFDRPGVVVVGCDIHDWMLAYIVVLETPWFATTGADGAATLAGFPPGRYRAEVWQPRLDKTATSEIALTPGAPVPPLAFTLALKPDRRIRRTLNATGGGGYK